MDDLLKRTVLAPLILILASQTVITMSSYALPVIAPLAAKDMGLAPASIGGLMTVVYLCAMVIGLGSGSLVGRLGATRVFQLLLLFTCFGIAALAAGHPVLAFLGALLIGVATGPMNPCGSSVLARISPPQWQPLVFSLKQCGTPSGGMLAGALLPALALLYDWRLALMIIPAVGVVMIIVLTFNRPYLDAPERRAVPLSLAGTLRTLKLVISHAELRRYAITGMSFATCQIGIASYLVVFLWEKVAMSPAQAGAVFAAFHVSGIVARIILGFFAGRMISTRALLTLLGLIMAFGTATIILFTQQWPTWSIYGVICALGASANGWVGLFLSEVARLAPEGETAAATGGVQFFMYFGIGGGPAIFLAILKTTDGYDGPFLTFAAIALLASGLLLTQRR